FRIPPLTSSTPSHSFPDGIISLASAKFAQSGVPSSSVGTGTGVEPTSDGSLTPTTKPRIISVVAITRLPFLSATWIPVIAALIWGLSENIFTMNWTTFSLILIGASCLHLAANTFNDYFDWTSGTDQINNDYFLQLSGGSRAIELGLISVKQLFVLGTVFLLFAGLMGIGIMLRLGENYLDLFYYGVAGAFSGYFYTGYPLRLVARKGLGELLIGLNFGPLMTMGTVFAMSGVHSWDAFILGIPLGLLTTAILWINQFPDMKSDEIAGKHHLVVVLGLEKSSWVFLLIIMSAFISIISINYYDVVDNGVLLSLLALPLALFLCFRVLRDYDTRKLSMANWATIGIHFITGVLMIIGIKYM
ncbi:MAG: hypothetical protein CL993_04295, partial [Euryarchaeota archaeon]|nr:hypothetical protein [Euryarchaeota archaeon]